MLFVVSDFSKFSEWFEWIDEAALGSYSEALFTHIDK
jgi:hypothetical protein